MARSSNFSSIQDVIQKILNGNSRLPDFEIIQIKKNWQEIIGVQLCKHAHPDRIQNNTLYIRCDHQGWINTLQLYKNEIMSKIQKMLNQKSKITDVKFYYKSNYHK